MRRKARTSHPFALLAVGKCPTAGVTKTRLSPPLSPQEAAHLYECFLKDSIEQMRQVKGVQPVLAYDPPSAYGYFAGLGADFDLIPQEGADLGARLDAALSEYLHAGYQAAAIMNTDSPTLPATYLQMAFRFLETDNDMVLGPCDDGGYYLIGLKQPAPRVLREVRMSTENTAAETIAIAREEGLRVRLLPEWYDVDDQQSLERLYSELTNVEGHIAPHTRAYAAAHSQLRRAFP